MSNRDGSFSVRHRLLLVLLVTVTLAWLVTVLLSYLDTQREVNDLLDAHLAQSAALLVAQTSEETGEIDTEPMPYPHPYSHKVAFQIWEEGRSLLLHSANAPRERLSPQEEGFSDAVINGEPWRVFAIWDQARRRLIQVGEHHEVRDRIARSIIEHLLQPLVIALPALAIGIWFGVAQGLQPLTRLSTQVAQRDPENLTPLKDTATPVEVAPLVASLNRLFERMHASLENERRFNDDAAHELRTPLAAIKTQAQVARAANTDAERRRVLDNVIAGCDRATHLVEQLLTLARLNPEQLKSRLERCDLRAVAVATTAELVPMAFSKGIEVELGDSGPAEIAGNTGLLRILLRNLIDNAIRYSPSGCRVRVDVTRDATRTMLSVTDQGPGIAVEERENIWRRFYRILGSGETGSGLGLSIVKRIADIHHATITLTAGDQDKGLRVNVIF